MLGRLAVLSSALAFRPSAPRASTPRRANGQDPPDVTMKTTGQADTPSRAPRATARDLPRPRARGGPTPRARARAAPRGDASPRRPH